VADALSGGECDYRQATRAVFDCYDSFEAWDKDVRATQNNATLSAALDRASVADGDLLSDADASALVYSDEYSLRSAVDIPPCAISRSPCTALRPGHDGNWDTIVKMVKAAYEKIPDVRWAVYLCEVRSGQQ
jgi:hypothetical protein